jgi:hypothetical protein
MAKDQGYIDKHEKVYEDLRRRFEFQVTNIISGGTIAGSELRIASELATTVMCPGQFLTIEKDEK